MSKNAASEEVMGRLHAAVAQKLITQLSQDEVDPRVITAAIAFLNNNKITMNPYITDAISEIEARLQTKTAKFKVVGKAEEAAKRFAAEG